MITVIGSLKGGSGKSTVTFNLAIWLMTVNRNVITYDLDPQCTLTDVLQLRREENYQPLFKVHNRYPNKAAQKEEDGEVLIDVGAANMAGMRRAIAASNRVVIPVTPSQADIWSVQRFLYIIASCVTDRPPSVWAFINRADTHSSIRESDQAEEALKVLPGIRVLETRLCQRTTYRRSFSEGLAVFELDGSGKAAQEFQAFAKRLYG